MPLYDFICRACGCAFEVLVRGSDRPSCPQCQSHDLAKQVSAPAARTGNKGASASRGGGKCSGCAGGNCRTCR